LALSAPDVERAVSAALRQAGRDGVQGGAVTPYLLDAVSRETGGRTLDVNLGLLEANARLAAEIARAVAAEA
jgi:pseudouridine-5'-phosphate glycosidase